MNCDVTVKENLKKAKIISKRHDDKENLEIIVGNIDSIDFKEKQFEVYKKTNEYLVRKKELKKDGWKQKDIDGFLRSFVTEYTEKLLVE